MAALHEQYRPRCWDDVVGQEAGGNLRAVLQRVESGQLEREARAGILAELQRPIAEQCPRRRAELQAQLAAIDGKA